MSKPRRPTPQARAKKVTSSNELAKAEPTTVLPEQTQAGRDRGTGPLAPTKASPSPNHPKRSRPKRAGQPGREASTSTKVGTGSKRDVSEGTGAVPPPAASETVKWRRHGASAQEVAQLKGEAAGRTFRVRTVTERSDGAGMVTTYSVPGGQFAVWLSELQGRRDDEAETILSIWVV